MTWQHSYHRICFPRIFGTWFTDALESGYDLNAESHDCASGSAVLETCDTTRAEQPTNHVKGVR